MMKNILIVILLLGMFCGFSIDCKNFKFKWDGFFIIYLEFSFKKVGD